MIYAQLRAQRERGRGRQRRRERESGEREGEKEILLYFSTVNIFAHRPTDISVVATDYY